MPSAYHPATAIAFSLLIVFPRHGSHATPAARRFWYIPATKSKVPAILIIVILHLFHIYRIGIEAIELSPLESYLAQLSDAKQGASLLWAILIFTRHANIYYKLRDIFCATSKCLLMEIHIVLMPSLFTTLYFRATMPCKRRPTLLPVATADAKMPDILFYRLRRDADNAQNSWVSAAIKPAHSFHIIHYHRDL